MFLVSVTYVQGFVLQETAPMRAVEAMGGTPADAMAVVTAEIEALPSDVYPHLGEVSHYLTTLNLDERFAWGLECILDGLALRLDQQRA
jgi:hypothetical protein